MVVKSYHEQWWSYLKSGNTSKWFFFHTMAHRNTVVWSFWTSSKMLSYYQILWQSFEMERSYWTTCEPSWDCKLTKSLTILQKETGASLICVDESDFTCLLCAQSLGNAGFNSSPMDNAVRKANSSKEQVLLESHGLPHHFQNWVLSKPVFCGGKPQHRMVNVVETASLDTWRFHF